MSDDRIGHVSESLNVGRELKRELEVAARRENRDATNLGRLLIREGLAERARVRLDQSSPNSNAAQAGQ